MKERYEGEDGKRRLVEVFAQQELVQHNNNISNKLAELATIEEYQKEKQLYIRGELGKNFLFFILSGSLDLFVQDKHVTILESGQAVGEFPIIDPSLTYAVTAVAREHSLIASVSEEQFLSIAQEYPEIWKNMVKMLVSRLRMVNELPVSDKKPSEKDLKPADLTIGQLMKGLTTSELWKIIVAIITALATVATIAYKIGSGAWK